MRLSDKQKTFIKDFSSELDFLEGTIRSGKSYAAIIKFMLRVADMDEENFIIAAEETTTAERNLIDNKGGILHLFGNLVEYKTNSIGGKHLEYKTPKGLKKIYVVGFYNKRMWKKILGSTLGGGLLDEINLADIEFVKEYFGRMATVENKYTVVTSNPDDPYLPIYKEFLNKCRPKTDVPPQIMEELRQSKPKDKWDYWHFDFHDNPLMTDDKIKTLKETYHPDSSYYKTKIIGIRGKSEGIIYKKFNDKFIHDLSNERNYHHHSIGVDYGETDATAFTHWGFRDFFKYQDVLSHYYHKNGDYGQKDINDYVSDFFDFAADVYKRVQRPIEVWVDSAEKSFLQLIKNRAVLMGIRWLIIKPVNKAKENPQHKSAIKERISVFNQMLGMNTVRIDKSCKELINAISQSVYDKNGDRLDNGTTNIDSLDSMEYGIKPYFKHITTHLQRGDYK